MQLGSDMFYISKKLLQNKRNTSGVGMNFDSCSIQQRFFWSEFELVRIKSHGFINKTSPRGLHTIHSFNFLKWIKAMQTHQAVV